MTEFCVHHISVCSVCVRFPLLHRCLLHSASPLLCFLSLSLSICDVSAIIKIFFTGWILTHQLVTAQSEDVLVTDEAKLPRGVDSSHEFNDFGPDKIMKDLQLDLHLNSDDSQLHFDLSLLT